MLSNLPSGFYVRVCRDDKWQTLDIAELTPDELRGFFLNKSADEITRWLVRLMQIWQQADRYLKATHALPFTPLHDD